MAFTKRFDTKCKQTRSIFWFRRFHMHLAGEFSAEKCFYLGRQLNLWPFWLDNISKSTLLESFLMCALFVSNKCCVVVKGVALIHEFSLHISVNVPNDNLVVHQGICSSKPGC